MDFLDKIREFFQNLLSSGLLKKVIETLKVVMDAISKLWEWLYGTVTGLFR